MNRYSHSIHDVIELCDGLIPRFEVQDVVDFCLLPKRSQLICGVYGLRRTGKTVILAHTIKQLLHNGVNPKLLAYWSMTPDIDMSGLIKLLNAAVKHGTRYLFIDEITEVSEFARFAAVLADKYAVMGLKIVISGTNSLGIHLASRNSLYDRIVLVKTTFLSFAQYKSLFPKRDILRYIHSGGILQTTIKQESAAEYIETAVVENIVKTFNKLADVSDMSKDVQELWERGLLRKVIEQSIIKDNLRFTADEILKEYENNMIREGISMSIGPAHSTAFTRAELQRINSDICDSLRFEYSEVIAPDWTIDYMLRFLKGIDVLREYTIFNGVGRSSSAYVYTQPSLRCRHALSATLCAKQILVNRGLSKSDIEGLYRKTWQGVEGHLMEHAVIAHALNYTGGRVCSSDIPAHSEIDVIVVADGCADLLEVKRSDKRNERQGRHLRDTATVKTHLNQIECSPTITTHRAVIYRGESCFDYGIEYINIEELLTKWSKPPHAEHP